MNQSSLFSFEESSVWDPKIIRKRLIIPEDQLAKLHSIPGWTKVQDNRNTLQFDKDFSIESSQSECCVNVTENSQRIKKNTDLFNEQISNRKLILETYKVYRKKLTRSLSFFTIDKSYETLLNSRTLKRTLSLQSVCQASDVSHLNNYKNFKCESFVKKNYKISDSEAPKSTILFLSKEVSKTMETESEPSVINIPTLDENSSLHFEVAKKANNMEPTENTDTMSAAQLVKNVTGSVNVGGVDLHPEIAKESNGILLADDVNLHSAIIKENVNVLPVENCVSQSNNVSDQPIKHATESVIADNAELNSETKGNSSLKDVDNFDSHSKITKVSNIMLHAGDRDLFSETTKEGNSMLPAVVSHETAKITKDPVNAENLVISSFNKHTKSYVPVLSENCKSDMNNIKEIPANNIAIGEKTASLNVDEGGKFFSSDLCNTNGTNLIVKETSVDNIKSNPLQDTKQSPSIFNDKYLDSKLESVQKAFSNLNSSEKFVSVLDSNKEYYYKSAAISVKKNYDENLDKLYPSKSIATVIPSSTPVNASETKHLVENSGSDSKIRDTDNEQKECDDKTYDPVKPSVNNEPSFSKKRKLESKNKRSKRLKSEEKQGNLKIRSIKKVGEISYSVEEVETMLDVLKQFL